MSEEETKQAAAAPATEEAVTDEIFFINEEQFESVVPEFGTCGKDADEAEDHPAAQSSCQKTDCCKKKADTTLGEPVEETKTVLEPLKKLCYKCKEKAAQFKNKQDIICRECLCWILSHRFKNALVRHVQIQKDYPNLVAVSGGSNSMAMLYFIHGCLNGNKSQKKMFFKIHVLYIDET